MLVWFSDVWWFAVAVFCLRLIYATVVYYPFLLSKVKSASAAYTGGVSVVVCVHNGLENIKRLMGKLLEQDFPNYEIVLVDDRSDEEAYLYMYDLAKREPKIKFSRIESTPAHISSKKYALTLGIKHAAHDVILLTDADCIPASKAWITRMTAPFAQGKSVVLGYSGYQKEKGFLNAYIRYETLLTALSYFSFARLGMPYMGVGRNLAYRKEVFLKNKGFHPYESVIGGDDDLLVQSIASSNNTSYVYEQSAHTVSIAKNTFSGYLIQKKRHLSVGKCYLLKFKLLLNLPYLLTLLFYIALFLVSVMALSQEELYAAVGIYLLSLALFTELPFYTGRKLKDQISALLMPLFEIYHIIHYFVIGMWATVSKNIRW